MYKDTMEILKECGAILNGHFLLSSGLHSNVYCQCAKLFQYPDKAATALEIVTDKLKEIQFDVIVGPALGGITVAYELGRMTGKRAIFAERENGTMTIRRGFEINSGERVIISEDVVTTGKSSLEVAKVIESFGAEVVAIACVVDRSSIHIKYPIISSIKLPVEAFLPEKCPLCKNQIPYIKPGSRNIK